MKHGRDFTGTPQRREELITTSGELREALDEVKKMQLLGWFKAAEKIIFLVYLSTLKDPFQEREILSAGDVYDYRSPLGCIVWEHCEKFHARGFIRRDAYDDVMSEVFLGLRTGKVLLGNLPELERRLKTAKKMGKWADAEKLEKKIKDRREKLPHVSSLSMVGNYISYAGTKPGSAGIQRILGIYAANRPIYENVLHYRSSDDVDILKLVRLLEGKDVQQQKKEGETIFCIPEQVLREVCGEKTDEECLKRLFCRGEWKVRPMRRNGNTLNGKYYYQIHSTEVLLAPDREGSLYCVNGLTLLNVGRRPDIEDIFQKETEHSDAEAMAKTIIRIVSDRLTEWKMPFHEFALFCYMSSEIGIRTPVLRYGGMQLFPNTSGILVRIRRNIKQILQEAEKELKEKGMLTEKVRAVLQKCQENWIIRKRRNHEKNCLCGMDIIVECIAWGVRRSDELWET